MPALLNRTHDGNRRSWVEPANQPESDFPLQNLPFGTFLYARTDTSRVGVAIGDSILDIRACADAGLLNGPAAEAAQSASLAAMMALPASHLTALREQIFDLLEASSRHRPQATECLLPQNEVSMLLPAASGDYTDFYASIHHATRVGEMFRPERPLLPNYKHVPIGYHGRASSLVPDDTPVRRPWGQRSENPEQPPVFAPSAMLDYELEVGAYIRGGNPLGQPVPISAAHGHIFGLCLLNDWSARDIQSWEYQPLGPFLGKSFATTVSPWVVTAEALAPFRVAATPRPDGDPAPLPYLWSEDDQCAGAFRIELEAWLTPKRGRPFLLSRGSFADMYWTFAQMIAHHTSNGCNLRPADLLGSGTVSGVAETEAGCLLELTRRGKRPLTLPDGSQRGFLEDGDTITLRGRCRRDGFASIGFGECSGTIRAALAQVEVGLT